jgi:hypothetical protein
MMGVDTGNKPILDSLYKKYRPLRPLIWVIRILAGTMVYYLSIGLFFGTPILIYYLLGYSFPTIHLDYILHKTVKIFFIGGIIPGIYYLVKWLYYDRYQFKDSVSKKYIFFHIVFMVLIIIFLSFLFVDYGVMSSILSSYAKSYRTERIIITFIIFFLPAILGGLSSFKKITLESTKKQEEIRKREAEQQRKEEARKKMQEAADALLKKWGVDKEKPSENIEN